MRRHRHGVATAKFFYEPILKVDPATPRFYTTAVPSGGRYMTVDASETRAALARVLASGGFTAAPNLAAFLRYVVEETLAGRGDRLKAYTIAVAALDRAENFDPNDNPLVRVQARRLRAALTRYYETEGLDDPLLIDLPVGSYLPRFAPRVPGTPPLPVGGEAEAAGETTDEAETDAPTTTRRFGRLATAVVAVTLGVAATLAGLRGWEAWRGRTETNERSAMVLPEPAGVGGLDAAAVLPLLVIEVDGGRPPVEGLDAEAYRRRIETFAARFDDMVLVTRRAPSFRLPPGQPLYRLQIGFVREGATVTAHYQLVHAGSERSVTTGAYRFKPEMARSHTPGTTLDTPTDLDIVRDLAKPNGAIVLDAIRLADVGEAFSCLAMGTLYVSERNATLLRAARACLEAEVAANPRLGPAHALLAETLLREWRRGGEGATPDLLTRAEATARRETTLAPLSASPRMTLAEILAARGDATGAATAGHEAVELNPEDMTVVARYGALSARLGQAEEATKLLRRAEANSPVTPAAVLDHLFLVLELSGRPLEADRLVRDPSGTGAPLHLATAAIHARRNGDEVAAQAALDGLIAQDAAFRDDPITAWRRRGFAESVAERLVSALRLAGLPPPWR